MVLQLVFQYVANLTVGLIAAMLFFLYTVGQLVMNYGEGLVSGLLFFFLVFVSCLSVVFTYEFARCSSRVKNPIPYSSRTTRHSAASCGAV